MSEPFSMDSLHETLKSGPQGHQLEKGINKRLGTGDMAQCLNCSLCKHEDSQNPKKLVWKHTRPRHFTRENPVTL